MGGRVHAVSWLGILIIVTACSAGFPAANRSQPGASDAPTPASKRITAGIRGAPKSLSQQKTQPQLGSVPGLDGVEQLVHAGLVQGNDRGLVIPQLAEAVPSLENGLWKLFPDGRMETTWQIKPAVTWHDGMPLTADDLLFAMRVEQDKDLAIPRHAVYGLI
jgi:ABC-type transport system substrate-binding protein